MMDLRDQGEATKSLPSTQQSDLRGGMTDTLSYDESSSAIVGGEGNGLLTMPNGRSIPFKAHPLADLFPMMSADEMAALVEDVRDRGVQRPIVLLDGMVLDGRNRYMAARDAGVGYRVVEFTGEDPLGFVISENMRRRHLTDSQRAMVAAKIAKLPKGANQHSVASADLPTLSTADAAEQLNVPVRTVTAAKAVVRDGTAELVAAVDAGEVSVSAAAEVAKLPEAEQQQIVAHGPAAVKEAAKAARQKPDTVAKAPARPASNLTPEALAEENEALKAYLETVNSKLAAVTRERDDLKARVADLSAENQGPVISKLQQQVAGLKYKLSNAEDAAKRAEFKEKKAMARVKELESMPVDMGV